MDRLLAQWAAQRPDLDAAPMGVVGRISRAARLLERHLADNFAAFDLQPGEFDVLATLRRAGPPHQLSPTRLYQAMMVASGTMTARLDRLERAGLITRRPDPGDRRGRVVVLTERGRVLVDTAVVAHLEVERDLLAALDERQQRTLADLLARLLADLEDRPERRAAGRASSGATSARR